MEPPKRTLELMALGPPDRHSRQLLAGSCALVLVLMFGWGVLCAGVLTTSHFIMRPGLTVVGMSAAVALALPYLVGILWLDRNEPEPPWLLATAIAWGAVGATSLSLLGNGMVGSVFDMMVGAGPIADQMGRSFAAPLVEESAKALVLGGIYVVFRHHFDNVLDGIIYGALVGLGFAVFENFIYYLNQETWQEAMVLVVLRGIVTAPGTHMSFTALTGAFLGLFRVSTSGRIRWLFPLIGLLLSMFAHFCWNTIPMFILSGNTAENIFVWAPLAVVVVQVPFLLLLLVTAVVALRHERELIERFIGLETSPVVQEGELERLVPARRRTSRVWGLMLTGRFKDGWLVRRRNRLLIQLAFEKWHMEREVSASDPSARVHAAEIGRLRKVLSELPAPPA